MTEITPVHINRLIEFEASVRYDEAPPDKEKPFIVENRKSPILISAPHGARTFRDDDKEVWHEEDEYTAGLAQLLGEICDVSVIATVHKNEEYDPNYVRDDSVPYKQTIRTLIEDSGVKFVIDLHGAALNSRILKSPGTIDLGFRGKELQERSMSEKHVQTLEALFTSTDGKCPSSDFVVCRNKFPARGRGTITTFVFCCFGLDTGYNVQSVQIEMKPQVRIARRFQTATLYKSCGDYEADSASIFHTIETLSEFIEYLKDQSE